MQGLLVQWAKLYESTFELLQVWRISPLYSLWVSEALAEAKDVEERGRWQLDILHLEIVRMRDLQEALPLCL